MKNTYSKTTAVLALTTALTGCGVFTTNSEAPKNQDSSLTVIEKETVQNPPEHKEAVTNTPKETEKKEETKSNKETPSLKEEEKNARTSVVPAGKTAVTDGTTVNTVSTVPADWRTSSVDETQPIAVNVSSTASTDTSAKEEKKEDSPVVIPADAHTAEVLRAAAELSAAKKVLENAEAVLAIAKQNYEEALSTMKKEQTLAGNQDIVEAAKANLGEKMAVLEIAENNRTAAEEKLEAARETYEQALVEINTDYDSRKNQIDTAYETAVKNAEETYQNTVAEAEEKYSTAVSKAEGEYASIQESYTAAMNGITAAYQDAVNLADQEEAKKIESARTDYDQMIQDAETAFEEKKAQYEAEYNAAVKEAEDTYQQNLDAARTAYEDALETLDSNAYKESAEKYEAALAEQKEFMNQEEAAKQELQTVINTLEQLQETKRNADAAVAEKESDVKTAKETLSQAMAALVEARKAASTAESDNASLKAKVAEAEQAVREAAAAKEEAERGLEEVKQGNGQTDYDALIAEAQENVNTSKANLQAIQNQIDVGAYAFFAQQGDYAACSIISGTYNSGLLSNNPSVDYETLASYTNPGDPKSAVSLENVLRSLKLIEQVNEKRAEENQAEHQYQGNLEPYKITNSMMAVSMLSANYSQKNGMQHPSTFRTSENLASRGEGYAVNAWYGERNLFWKDPALGEQYKKMSAYQLYVSNPALYMSVGHYLNIVSTDKYIGIAIAGNNGMTAMNTASGLHTGEKAYTVEEYRALFTAYYNELMSAKETAEAELAQAESALEKAKADKENGGINRTALAEAQARVDQAHENLNAANAVLSSANLELKDSETILAEAEQRVQTLEEDTAGKEAIVASAESALQTEMDNAETIASEIASAEETKTEKETAVTAASEAVTAADEKTTAAKQAMDAEKAALDEQIQEKADAVTAAENSTIAEEAEQEALAQYQAKLETAEEEKTDAVEAANTAFEERKAVAASEKKASVSEAEAEKQSAEASAKETAENDKANVDASLKQAETEKTNTVDQAWAKKESEDKTAEDSKNSAYETLEKQQNIAVEDAARPVIAAEADVRKTEETIRTAEADVRTAEAAVRQQEALVSSVEETHRTYETAENNAENARTACQEAEQRYSELTNSEDSENAVAFVIQ